MKKRIIELNEEEIKELILKRWADDREITEIGFFTVHCNLREKSHTIFKGNSIKLKKVIFEFTENEK